MATITLKGNPLHTAGELPAKGSKAPDFKLINTDMASKSLADYAGKKLVLNIFPSVDTPVCAASVRKFNEEASKKENTVVLNISKDLPFALKRFCGAEGLEGVESLSEFKVQNFSEAYQVAMTDGPLAGLMSRAVVVLNEEGVVVHTEQVPEIAQEPDYEGALNAI
jgi:thiol peroxidase